MLPSRPELLVPLPEINQHPANKHFSWQIPVPEYACPQNIAFDLSAIHTCARSGALHSVTFVPGKKQTEDEPDVAGMSSDGTATSAIGLNLHRRKHQDIKLSVVYSDKGMLPFWHEARIAADIACINERLSRKGHLRDPEAWAQEFNHIVINGIRRAALKNTLKNNFAYGIATLFGIPLAYAIPELAGSSMSNYSAVLFAETYYAIMALRDQRKEGRKAGLAQEDIVYSALPFGIDRMGHIALTSLKHRKLVRHLPAGSV